MLKFISNKSIISQFKASKLFKTDLGRSFLNTGKGGLKADLSRQEEFVQFYHGKTNGVKLHKEGSIGQIEFYTDYTIRDQVIVYYDQYDFTFVHNQKTMRDKGIEKYLGSIIKEVETKFLPNIKHVENEEKGISQEEKMARAQNKIKTNPGMVTYDDIKELLKNKKRR